MMSMYMVDEHGKLEPEVADSIYGGGDEVLIFERSGLPVPGGMSYPADPFGRLVYTLEDGRVMMIPTLPYQARKSSLVELLENILREEERRRVESFALSSLVAERVFSPEEIAAACTRSAPLTGAADSIANRALPAKGIALCDAANPVVITKRMRDL